MYSSDSDSEQESLNENTINAATSTRVYSDPNGLSDGKNLIVRDVISIVFVISERIGYRMILNAYFKGTQDFKGSFAYSSLLTQAPNPCLNIDGVGLIGLSLPERDAKSIIGCASQAPYGHGDRTLVNTEVRDTWEISPANVKFNNPEWDAFVQNVAINTVCRELGAAHVATPPKVEFYKLLPYQTGSHFLPHSDTPKVDGMFATMVILLPSQYTGGQVHLEHADQRKVIDFSASSLLGTAALAWYTLLPGYRLALSYNIVHTSTEISRPLVPTTNKAAAALRDVLNKWKNEEFEQVPEDNFVVYVLRHKYCKNDIERSISCLKGEDAHKLLDVVAIAKVMNFSVFMANLQYRVYGTTDAVIHAQGGNGDSESPYLSTKLTIMNVADLDGNFVHEKVKLPIDWDCLVPKVPFAGTKPNQEQKEHYTGNESSHLSQWYRRAVLILVPRENLGSFLASVRGIPYTVKRMQDSGSRDMALINVFLSKLYCAGKATITAIIDLAITWQDLTLLREVIRRRGDTIFEIDKALLSQVWKVFGLENVRKIVEYAITCTYYPFERKARLIEMVQLEMDKVDSSERLKKWRKDLYILVIRKHDNNYYGDMPYLLSIADEFGFKTLFELPALKKGHDFFFLISLAKALLNLKARPDPVVKNVVESRSQEIVTVLDACFQTSIIRWDEDFLLSCPSLVYNRNIYLLELFITAHRMELCENLLELFEKFPHDTCTKFQRIYVPLLAPLQKLLKKKQIDPCSPPFDHFLRTLIGYYLQDMLGTTTHSSRKVPLLGCGCGVCQQLDAFMNCPDLEETSFRMSAFSESQQKAIGGQILDSLGEDLVEKLMGDRYPDVAKALRGQEAFCVDLASETDLGANSLSAARPKLTRS
ncbi:hypothetical protein AMATHDRAFT_8674 [Amanita thiersii Skay4041]|uniref:Prolyl 4-hydroxylase alpha subunit Fe(2+) 2OG dioxygenase domain-containing protein n=1 Tax=Amanita thiersii Skay4041 TaxID=703135 RepID=A0A2A9NBZ7_9AGAR|nr:hypothetical protein AMATHDRAFT_8674 [Amanita thiersii Skay4041]